MEDKVIDMNFKENFNNMVDLVNKALDSYLPEKDAPEKNVYNAMRYSLLCGGKRLRPVLALAVTEMLGGDIDETLPFACALEMIHTYSLIHDDLPAMDNDDYRRGRLTNHKVYGEAIAILAGDALLNYAIELMLEYTIKSGDCLNQKLRTMEIIAKAAGTSGMIGGQVVDMESEGKTIPTDLLKFMHEHKTGAMIEASILSAAVLNNASQETLAHLTEYAESIGLAFQIKDDILDVEGDSITMGKKSGSDESNNKSTFVTIYGIEDSKKMLDSVTNSAIRAIDVFGEKGLFLKDLANYLVYRKN
jgi:geranylgeranyl diphosphate synthase, type II